MLTLFAVVSIALVILTAVLPLRCSRYWKIALGCLVCLVAFKFQIFRLFRNPEDFTPDLPLWLVFASTWLHSAFFLFVFILLFLTVLWFGFRLVMFLCHRKITGRMRRIRNLIHGSFLILSMLLAGIGMWLGRRGPVIREVTLPLLKKGMPDLKLVLLSDLHVDHLLPDDKLPSVVAQVNNLNPDAVLITGDFADGSVTHLGGQMLALLNLRAPLGVFGVLGNHEYYYAGWKPWLVFLKEKAGVNMLVNESVVLREGIVLGGTADLQGNKAIFGGVGPDLKETFRDKDPDAVRLLMAHQPKMAEEAAQNGVAMQFSGHTHGGMIRGLDYLIALSNHGYVSGLYDVNGMKLYVSNGTGIWSGFPVRLGRPEEITLIRLTAPAE